MTLPAQTARPHDRLTPAQRALKDQPLMPSAALLDLVRALAIIAADRDFEAEQGDAASSDLR
jgi:hypothetical protein